MVSPGEPGMVPEMVIVGAGECGARAAFALRDQGYEGPVTLVGRERHLPYERPPLSKALMAAADGEPTMMAVTDHERLAAARIAFVTGTEVVAIDRATKTVRFDNDAALPYAKLLLAIGSSPRRLPMAENIARCVYLRTFDDAVEIRAHFRAGSRIAIIGGGFIGLELAASARRLGCTVTVIEAQDRILMRGVPAEIAVAVRAEHQRQGVRILCGTGIAAIEDLDDGVRIVLAGGDTVSADLCIVGIGAVPCTELALQAGLAVDNGIVVDQHLHTADPDILAAGDCCAFPLAIYGGRHVRLEAWRNAQEQGVLAAANMLGRGEAHGAVPWFWSDQYDLSLQVVGLADEGADVVRRDVGEGTLILFHLAADGRLVAASGIGRGNAVARDIRLAEMLIARRAVPPRDKLAEPQVKLKALLAA